MEFVNQETSRAGFAGRPRSEGAGIRLTCWKTLGAAAICLCVATPGSAATFSFENGDVIEGEIIDATRNTVVIREGIGGMRQLSRSQLKTVRIKTQRGKVISGPLVGWRDGRYEIKSGIQLITVRKQRIVAVAPLLSEATVSVAEAVATQAPVQETDPASTASVAIKNATPVKQAEVALNAVTIVKPRPKPGEQVSPVSDAITTLNPDLVIPALATAPNPMPAGSKPTVNEVSQTPPELTVSEVQAGEDTSEMVFELKLSRPANQPIMVLYATYDKTAVAGKDYEGERGIVTLAPGASSARVRVPLIDDTDQEEDETLELFVSVDKSRATLEVDRTVGTILNDDE